MAASQGMPKVVSKTVATRKSQGRIPLQFSEGARFCQQLDFERSDSGTLT